MALFHFDVRQIKRSAGQSAIACAAYRSDQKLYSDYYGEWSDYSRKGVVIGSEILLPDHAPREYADRQTLWNAVEFAERGKKAQLAYSFELALQTEFSVEENMALARQFLLEHFVSRGMIVDVCFHEPDRDPPNPHSHFMCPIRPLNPDGTWGQKQRREYLLDENGERIKDNTGHDKFNAVPTTDWGDPETLEFWREKWAELSNAKFEEKGLTERIDHRSYERQGVHKIPTIHEGPAVRAMESEDCTPSLSQAQQLKKLSQSGLLDMDKTLELLRQPKGNQKEKISLNYEEIRRFFPKHYTPKDVIGAIMRILEADYKRRQRKKSAER